MSQCEPLVVSNLSEAPQVLQQRFQRDGYLHFKNVIATERCQALLQQFIACLSPHVGYDQTLNSPVLQGEPFYETDATWNAVYPKMQSLYDFHNFFHQPDVQQLMRIVCGDQVFVYPMKMGRVATPGKVGYETPPHQDAYSHQAGMTMAGIWIPLHDVSEGMGRLQMLPGSHKQGVRQVFKAAGVGGVQCEILPEETIWHVADVKQGDVILFHSCCVHRAEPNTSQQKVRISIDTRFCDYGAPVFVTNIEPHHGCRIDGLNWERIYQHWQDDTLQYYWQDYPGLYSEMRSLNQA
jgi:ectoine hydroxylase-related dioxygenase (phytanoyl-CoA dioxygenase family)